ncbi:MAG: adenylosuccinate lyase [Candidatus Acetothermia bacterium]|jgi:adenylosuccinate lyase|nr:adenylosuccinate lyase [Candidatus Acetothermia bacterium]
MLNPVMFARYALPPMKDLWTMDAQYQGWLSVELAALGALEELGHVPSGVTQAVRAKAEIDLDRIRALEQEVGHDLVAFLWALEEEVGPEARWLHFGLTSSDVKDTALALTLVQALDLVIGKASRLGEALGELAQRYQEAPILGRTHGQWAEPTTFGLKVLAWHDEVGRVEDRLRRAREGIAVGKLSGAVGTYAYFPPEAEERALTSLGLRPCPVATQVISRDRHAEVLFALASAASLVEKIALEVRHLSRSEVGEVEEGRPEGSSAMPHKRNPILSERLSGLARLVRAALGPALEDNALWHERDMSHSSVERVLFPQCFTLVDYMLDRAEGLMRGLKVFPDRMLARVAEARGLPFSEGLLLALVRKGMARREAHKLVARLSARAERESRDLGEVAREDPEVRARLSREELDAVFDLRRALRHVDVPFGRVLGEEAGYNAPGGRDA